MASGSSRGTGADVPSAGAALEVLDRPVVFDLVVGIVAGIALLLGVVVLPLLVVRFPGNYLVGVVCCTEGPNGVIDPVPVGALLSTGVVLAAGELAADGGLAAAPASGPLSSALFWRDAWSRRSVARRFLSFFVRRFCSLRIERCLRP